MLELRWRCPRCPPQVFAAQQDVAVAQMRMTSSVRLPLWEKEAAAREFFALHRRGTHASVGPKHRMA